MKKNITRSSRPRKSSERYHQSPLTWKFIQGPRKGQYVIKLGEETGCWIWQGRKKHGYGIITIREDEYRLRKMVIGETGTHRGHKVIRAHQLFYYLKYGNPPLDTELGHSCNRRSCCNPDHVEPMNHLQNLAEAFRMPRLELDEVLAIQEMIEDDMPLKKIANYYSVSVWSVRQISRDMIYRDQYVLDPEVPF